MDDEDIVRLLNELFHSRQRQGDIEAAYKLRYLEIVAVVQKELEALKDEFLPLQITAAERVGDIESLIREAVLEGAHSVKGEYLQAVYMKGKETVDMKALKGYAAAHPEVMGLVKVGEPSVQIRAR